MLVVDLSSRWSHARGGRQLRRSPSSPLISCGKLHPPSALRPTYDLAELNFNGSEVTVNGAMWRRGISNRSFDPVPMSCSNVVNSHEEASASTSRARQR